MNKKSKTSTPVSIHNAPHYTWGNQCDGWWLKNKGEFTAIAETMPPNTAEKKHYHNTTEQFFYCLEGQLHIQLEETEYLLSPHEGIHIQRGVPHKVKNRSQGTVHFLVISLPNSHDDRVDLE